MHEHALIHDIVHSILQTEKLPKDARVSKVRIRIGLLEMHSEDAFRQGFAVECRETQLAGAKLELELVYPTLECPACGLKQAYQEGEIDPHDAMPVAECPKCKALAPLKGGRGVQELQLVLD
ncbi:MAG: hydrogenase maturation nickel metallochaperone HypA [Elusimicrobia bacterium]|nr:hydrogenase maturation nickel metallochaperone HypA [Elusimicrobiota bacterium]